MRVSKHLGAISPPVLGNTNRTKWESDRCKGERGAEGIPAGQGSEIVFSTDSVQMNLKNGTMNGIFRNPRSGRFF